MASTASFVSFQTVGINIFMSINCYLKWQNEKQELAADSHYHCSNWQLYSRQSSADRSTSYSLYEWTRKQFPCQRALRLHGKISLQRAENGQCFRFGGNYLVTSNTDSGDLLQKLQEKRAILRLSGSSGEHKEGAELYVGRLLFDSLSSTDVWIIKLLYFIQTTVGSFFFFWVCLSFYFSWTLLFPCKQFWILKIIWIIALAIRLECEKAATGGIFEALIVVEVTEKRQKSWQKWSEKEKNILIYEKKMRKSLWYYSILITKGELQIKKKKTI